MSGRLFAVVGPSGAGKDTLLLAAHAERPDLHLVRRVITRPEAAGGEAFDGVSVAEFARRRAEGAFVLHWEAHGLHYGIPAEVKDVLARGQDALFNGSRAVLDKAAAMFPELGVIHVSARPDVLAARLAARGREDSAERARRLARADLTLPRGVSERLDVFEIDNSGKLEDATAAFLAVLQPVRA